MEIATPLLTGKMMRNVDNSILSLYLPDANIATGPAVVVCW